MRRSILPAVIALVALAVPAGASASFLIYRCGSGFENLCRINRDGSGKTQLTADGTGLSSYLSPSLSRNGTRLAFLYGGAVFSADANAQNRHTLATGSGVEAHISPDGTKVMGLMDSGFGSDQIESWDFNGSGLSADYYPTLAGGWAADHEIGDSQTSGHVNLPYSLCLLTDTMPRQCQRVVAAGASNDYLYLPALSPDGSTLAVEQVTQIAGVPSTIALYRFATGAFITDLTHGTADRDPTWAPDGKWIAFQRGTQIYKVPAIGGTPQLITSSGEEPTWGGPIDATPPPSITKCHVPRLIGKTKLQVQHALAGSHCALGTVAHKHARGAKKGHVISQSPTAGQIRPAGTKVNVVLAR